MKPFESFLAREFDQFIEYRRQLGLSARPLRNYLLIFDRYLVEHKQPPALLEPLFFLQLRANLEMDPRSVNTMLSNLRSFFQYLVRRGDYDQNPLRDIPPLAERYFVPFVFSPQQTNQLLDAACHNIGKTAKDFLYDAGIYLAIAMLARCGMRINEPLRLLKHHYRPDDGTIYIAKTKFRKDRLIPAPKVLMKEIEQYLAMQHEYPADDLNRYLLSGRKAWPHRDHRVRSAFRQAVRDIGLSRQRQTIGNINFGAPTPHSLRHSFAINTLKRIRERGGSPQQALPVLAAYMGHYKYQYTAAYLKVSDASDVTGLMAFAKSRLDPI
jgi:integrase